MLFGARTGAWAWRLTRSLGRPAHHHNRLFQDLSIEFRAVTTFRYDLSAITSFALVAIFRRDPDASHAIHSLGWRIASGAPVRGKLVRSQTLPEQAHAAIDRPVIRIASI